MLRIIASKCAFKQGEETISKKLGQNRVNEEESKFIQLLLLQRQRKPVMLKLFERKREAQTSAEIKNKKLWEIKY